MMMRYALWIPVALRLLFPFSVGESPVSFMNVFYGILPEMRQVQTGSIGQDTNQADGYLDGSEGAVDFDKQNSIVFGEADTVPQTAAVAIVPGQVAEIGRAHV